MKRFWHNFVQQDEYNTIRYEGRYIISISRLKMPSFVFFATDYQSAIRSFSSKCKWKDFDTSFVQQDEYNIWCNKIWRNVHYHDITFENASFCCFATDLETSVFNTMNTVYDTIRHEGRHIISISRLKMPSFVLFFATDYQSAIWKIILKQVNEKVWRQDLSNTINTILEIWYDDIWRICHI